MSQFSLTTTPELIKTAYHLWSPLPPIYRFNLILSLFFTLIKNSVPSRSWEASRCSESSRGCSRSGSGPISSRAARPCARVRSAPLGHLRARSRRGSGARLVSRGTRLSDYRAVLGTRPLPSCPASRRGLTARARHTHTLQTRPARNRFLLVVLRQIRVCSRRNAYAN